MGVGCHAEWFWLDFREADGLAIAAKIVSSSCCAVGSGVADVRAQRSVSDSGPKSRRRSDATATDTAPSSSDAVRITRSPQAAGRSPAQDHGT